MNAILFDNYGPYLWARARAASMGMDVPVLAVELYGLSAEYAWERNEGVEGLEKVTLLPNVDSTQVTAATIERRMDEVFARYPITTVAVPGWGYKGSLAAMRWGLRHGVRVILMSESTAWDDVRVGWKEWVKCQIVGLASTALVGGRPHADYISQLGMPEDRIFLGYDAVDNEFFAAEAARWRGGSDQWSVISEQKEVKEAGADDRGREEAGNSRQGPERSAASGGLARGETSRETDWRGTSQPPRAICDQQSTIQFRPYFLASNRFIEKKNLFRLIEAYSQYAKSYQLSVISDQEEDGGKRDANGQGAVGHALEEAQASSSSALHQQASAVSGNPATGNPQPSSIWNLCLLGDGKLREKLIARCHELGLQVVEAAPWELLETKNLKLETSGERPSVFFPGFRQIEELPRFYAHAGAFVHASTTEQWGLVVNEAMACGLPVIVSNRVGCATDLVHDGVNGFTFDPYAVWQLSERMVKSSSPDFPLAEFCEASRAIIADWGPERFASGLQKAVEKALEVDPPKVGILQRILLSLLLARG